MIKANWILLSTLVSFSAFGKVSFQEKMNRVEYLESLNSESVSMNIDAYRRELQYEKQQLSLEQRAENEASLLVEKIKVQIQKSYEAALKKNSPEEAVAEVRQAIEKDIGLIAPELRDEIREIALSILEDVENGQMSSSISSDNLQRVLISGVKARSEFLNTEADTTSLSARAYEDVDSGTPTSSSVLSDANKQEYKTKEELLESLALLPSS